MTSVRLMVAVVDGMPHRVPEPAPEIAPAVAAAPQPAALEPATALPAAEELALAADVPVEPAPSRAAGPRRRGLAALLRRPAEYLRAYLTASLDHQLQLQAERTVDVAGAVARLERAGPRTEASLQHAQAIAEAQALRLDAVSEGLAALSERLADVSGRQSADFGALARRLQAMDDHARLLTQTVAQHEEVRASQAADQIALGRRNAAAAEAGTERLDQVLGVLGPRFDELEIKVRPLVEIDADSVAVRTADGYVMLPRSEPLFVTAVASATSGGLEPGARRVLRALLRPDDACADVGANVGLLTVAMGFAVGPQGRVWAFEPEARVRAQLARTLHLNGLAQVALSGAAVGARAGRLAFHESSIIGHSSLYALPEEERAQAREVEVEVVTLDSVVPAGTALSAVKIDVEGAELDVLAGMRRVIADSPDVAIVAEFGPSHLRRVGTAPEEWFDAFAEHGLAPRLISEPGGATAPTSAAELADVESANLVFVRPGGAADGRLPR